MSLTDNKPLFLILLSLSIIFFAQGLSFHGIEYRDDEIFYFNSTKEMFVTDNFLSPAYFGENRFQKPILFYWFILLSYKLLGVSWFAARLPSVITASLTIALTWLITKELFNKKIATLSTIILATLPMFFRHAKNAVPDMTMNFFIVLAIYFMLKFFDDPSKKKYSYMFFLSCALGFMIKGFAALVVPFFTLIFYAIFTTKNVILKKINFPLGVLILIAVIMPWFLFMRHIHGDAYIQYMLKVETLNRTVTSGGQNILLKVFFTFVENALFYIQTIMSYFAPWSVFALVAIPFAIVNLRKEKEEKRKNALLLMTVWFFVVFIFFALIAHRINHLILVLTTPFAVLVSYFFLAIFKQDLPAHKVLNAVKKHLVLIIIFFGLLGISFVKVFLLGSSKLWIFVFGIIFISCIIVLQKSKNAITAPLALGLLLLCAFSQTALLSEARLTAHSSLQSFANTINSDIGYSDLIGVGSHDIHEKEFQAYFDKKIEKLATSDDNQTKEMLMNFFASDSKIYCLITKKDYETLLSDQLKTKLDIIQEDYIFRRRISVDKDFFASLARLDQDKIRDYFMEEVILIKKEKYG